MDADKQYIDRRTAYQEKVISLLEQLKKSLEDGKFEQAKDIEVKLRIANLDEEIHFKKQNLQVYKERLKSD